MAKILVVDDEPSIGEEFRIILQADGHQVDVALGGEEALQKLRQNSYDLIFLDVLMPHMEGREVFEKIKSVSEVPVAIISGYMPRHKEKEVLALGAVACLRKPIDLNSIKDLVNSVSQKK